MSENDIFRIEGGHPIGGTIRPSGNKNAALPLLAATLLTDQKVTLRNVPLIKDVEVMLMLLQDLGAEATWAESGVVVVQARSLHKKDPNPLLCQRIRGSVLLAGALLGRKGAVNLPPLGGDVIGRRRIDTHVLALEMLGASSELKSDGLHISRTRPKTGEIFFDEPSVTATENALMVAANTDGTTTLVNVASEPHVQDLCGLLSQMGAQIEGVGSNQLRITGTRALRGADFTLGPDYIEVGSLIALAAVTGGELRLKDARPNQHRATKIAFRKMGIHFDDDGSDIMVPAGQTLSVRNDLGDAIPKIEDSPWPGFPADLTSIAVVAATQSAGTILVFEKMFESRLFFVDRLISMGARMILCDPHRVVISGRSKLQGAEVSSPDIRAGMAMVIAALCAEGVSTIQNIHQIDRGYERIDERLSDLGAQIMRI